MSRAGTTAPNRRADRDRDDDEGRDHAGQHEVQDVARRLASVPGTFISSTVGPSEPKRRVHQEHHRP